MEPRLKRSRRARFSRSSIALVCVVIPAISLLFILNLSLPEVSLDNRSSAHAQRFKKPVLGALGEMMVAMLPNDLAFTVFAPSEAAFERILNLRANESLAERKMNDTFAILSRVMGFSTVPQHLPSQTLPKRKEVSLDSVSGFGLYIWKDVDGTLVANNVRSEQVDIRYSEIIVHVMSGVIMDAEFEQSFSPDY